MRSTIRRTAAIAGCTVLGTTMLVLGAGPAAAHPRNGDGVTRTVAGSAIGSLPSPDGELFVLLSVFDPPDQDAFAGVEIFGQIGEQTYECFEGPPVDADLDRLKEAAAEGRTRLLCSGQDLPADVVAHVKVDVEWDGSGRVTRERFTQEGCRVRNAIRQADVTGRVTVRIPELGVKVRITEGFGDLRRTRSVCRDVEG